jgi:hypothetical protein
MPRNQDLPEVIRDRHGNPIHRSRNLAGIRRYVAGCTRYQHNQIIKTLAIDAIGMGWEGKLSIVFDDGSSYETNFASYFVLLGFVKRWRNVRGAPLVVNGQSWGTVRPDHPAFANAR